MRKWIIFICIFIYTSSGFCDQKFTGNYLYSLCMSEKGYESLLCDYYFSGYYSGLMAGTTVVDLAIPDDQPTSSENIKDIFSIFLKYYPEKGYKQADTVVFLSMLSAGFAKPKKDILSPSWSDKIKAIREILKS